MRYHILSLVLLVFSVIAIPTSAQQSDPSLRLPGEAVDSITGGMPSVMIRRTVKEDRRFKAKHTIGVDLFRTLVYANLFYHYTLNGALTIGCKAETPPGILGYNESFSHWGVGLEVKYFPFADGPKGWHLSFATNYYAGTYNDSIWNSNLRQNEFFEDDFTAASAVLDIGMRYLLTYNLALEGLIGVERYMGGYKDIEDEDGVLGMVIYSTHSPYMFHTAFRLCVMW